MRNTFTVGAALIDQYDTDDLYDPDPNPPATATMATLLRSSTPSERQPRRLRLRDRRHVIRRSYFQFGRDRRIAPYPPPVPASYVLLNRRFENVGEFGYAYNPASTLTSKTLDFASSTSNDRAILDFFTYNTASRRAGIVNLNTRNGPVLASIIRGALLHDPGSENPPTAVSFPSRRPHRRASHCSRDYERHRGVVPR